MGSYRHERIDEDTAKEITLIIRTLKDPRIPPVVSVTSAHVTPDLKYCRAAVSIMGSPESRREAMEGLKSASGFIRRELSQRMKLRITPEISFVLDESLDHAVKINTILKSLEIKEADKDVPEKDK